MPALLIVDAANVVGSVPDGWWRDRAGATARLRDTLRDLAAEGLPAEKISPPLDIVLVVEGAARGIRAIPTVGVVSASGSGDDSIVDLVRAEAPNRTCIVVTADRQLRERVEALGGRALGPKAVR
ncbi:MAG: NTP pyrophosphohydrolase [Longispora sp.]|nr:NTP pyrophosphohydrolase [Longispora sp. (in: high G+C Gram-positive bacteria)]